MNIRMWITVYLSLHKQYQSPDFLALVLCVADNLAVLCPVEMTFPTFHSKGGALSEHLHQALYVYGKCSCKMSCRQEASL